MLSKLKKSDNKGFTIIEVMIVLAIAGLILLIVFLAVPALQRSSRNTQRKNDASAVSGAVGNFISNNGGALPAAGGVAQDPSDANSIDICAVSGCASGNKESAKLGYYTFSAANIKVASSSPGVPTKDQIFVVTGYACNSTNTGLGNPSSRTAAILFAVESSGSAVTEQCVEQ